MSKQFQFAVIVLLGTTRIGLAQQVSDVAYKPPVPRPAYKSGKGPRIVIDEAHHNFHTAEGRYKPFAQCSFRSEQNRHESI